MNVRRAVASLWAGSLWVCAGTAAYSFATMDRAQAGARAAKLFQNTGTLSLLCAVLLAVLVWKSAEIKLDPQRDLRRTLLKLIAAMAVCTLIWHVGFQPAMRALREMAGPGAVMDGALRTKFLLLHGLAVLVYGAQVVMAGFLVWRIK
ncbi:MAG TPA: DUF4149 domain-containing protein [Burkholderiaceae bacterium]